MNERLGWQMIGKARTGLTFLRHLIQTPNRYWAGQLTARKVPHGAACLDKATGRLRLKPVTLLLDRAQEFILGGFQDAVALGAVGARFFSSFEDGQEQVRVEVGGLIFIVETAEEIYILREIFVDGVYNFVAAEQVVVWDIGMNVGLASLYFAARPEVIRVVSYEPFAPTYRQAQKNISLNPEAARKITAVNMGVGDSERTLRVDYQYEIKGSIGIHGLPASAPRHGLMQEQLTLRPAAEIVDDLTAAYPNRDILAKIDCEGAEYEILRSLAAAQKLTHIRAYLIEWHVQGPDEILSLLNDAGFTTLSLLPHSSGTGMIYAVQTGRSSQTGRSNA